MTIRFIVLLIALLPAAANAQAVPDTAGPDMTVECNGRVYSKAEIHPSIKKGITYFEDSLSAYLQINKAYPQNMRGVYSFTLTTTPYILNIYNEETKNPQQDDIIKHFLVATKELWKPAVQNGQAVCFLVDLVIIIKEGKLRAYITP